MQDVPGPFEKQVSLQIIGACFQRSGVSYRWPRNLHLVSSANKDYMFLYAKPLAGADWWRGLVWSTCTEQVG